jgi:hypothetical protein
MLADKEKSKGAGGAGKVLATPQAVIAEIKSLWATVGADYKNLRERVEDKEAAIRNSIIWMNHNPTAIPNNMIQTVLRALIEGKKTEIHLLSGMRQSEESSDPVFEPSISFMETLSNIVALYLIVNPDKAEILDKHWAECKAIIKAGDYKVKESELPDVPRQAVIVNQYLGICEAAVDFYSDKRASSADEANKIFEDFVEHYLQKIPDLYIKKNESSNLITDYIIGHLTGVIPINHVMPNNKLTNTMTMKKGIVGAGELDIVVSSNKSKKAVVTICALTYAGDNKVTLSGKHEFTEYDRNVYNAVSSLFEYGDSSHIFTPAMVFRAMTGLQGSEKPTKGQVKSVVESIDKMRFLRAWIDCTEELKMRRITVNSKQINKGVIDTTLLHADKITIEAGGEIVEGYHLLKSPILYEYSALSNQVLTVPASMLEIKEVNEDGSIGARLSNTEQRIVIKGRLIRRIEGLRSGRLNNPVVALFDYEKDGEKHEGLYTLAGKPEASRAEAKRIRDDIQKMLEYWKATDYIKGYQAQKKRNQIMGYKIIV